MLHTESIIKSIEQIFSLSEENISSLTVMLADIEAERIYEKFSSQTLKRNYLEYDLLAKINLLNALLEIILENPNMELVEKDKRKELVMGLCGTVATLYEQILKQTDSNEVWRNMPYLVMYSMLSYMADRQTISDLVIKEYNKNLNKMVNVYHTFSTVEQLAYDTYYLIIFLMSNIKNYDGLMNLNSYIENANANLDKAQNVELEKDVLDLSAGLRIASFGNIIYLSSILKEYLFTGKIDSTENQDIFSVIDMYSYNAFYLLGNEYIEFSAIFS